MKKTDEVTIRDHFASSALTGIISNYGSKAIRQAPKLAVAAYEIADEMMKAREEGCDEKRD